MLSIEHTRDRATEDITLTFNTRQELNDYIETHYDSTAEYYITIKPAQIWIELADLPAFTK